VTLGLPKGRLLASLGPRWVAAGGSPQALDPSDRTLLRETSVAGVPVRVLLLKPDDVPTYVEHGAADAGVCGRDVVLERGCALFVPWDLGLGRCRMVVAAPEGPLPLLSRPLRVATKYPRIAAAHFAARGLAAECIFVQGSVETAPRVGLSDVIVDLVETGETLRQNGLRELETVLVTTAVVVVNRAALKLQRATLDALGRCLAAPPG
jgi:ATP phosphoribosyltransferase